MDAEKFGIDKQAYKIIAEIVFRVNRSMISRSKWFILLDGYLYGQPSAVIREGEKRNSRKS